MENINSTADIRIPIYDVYYAVIKNNVIDINAFADDDAAENEKAVYAKYLDYKAKVYETLEKEFFEKKLGNAGFVAKAPAAVIEQQF